MLLLRAADRAAVYTHLSISEEGVEYLPQEDDRAEEKVGYP